jgi:hypothetical protein
MTGHRIKAVTFADELVQTLHFEEMEDLQYSQIWYAGQDYMEMKANSRSDAKMWRRQGFDILMRDTFQFPRADAQEYINAFVMLEEEHCRRGLERFLSRQHGEERSATKDRARYTVLLQQRDLRKQGMKIDEIAETLRDVCKETSRVTALFARRLGIADEVVLARGEDSSHAEKILEVNQIKRGPGRMERRSSNFSVRSGHSLDSMRVDMNHKSHVPRRRCKDCPTSPASPTEELYAAIA